MARIDPKTFRKKRLKTKKLKRALPIIAGAILVLLSFWALNPGGVFTRGKVIASGRLMLKADKEKVDLGDVRLGTPVSTSFRITNTGDQTLEFTQKPYVEIVEGC